MQTSRSSPIKSSIARWWRVYCISFEIKWENREKPHKNRLFTLVYQHVFRLIVSLFFSILNICVFSSKHFISVEPKSQRCAKVKNAIEKNYLKIQSWEWSKRLHSNQLFLYFERFRSASIVQNNTWRHGVSEVNRFSSQTTSSYTSMDNDAFVLNVFLFFMLSLISKREKR